MNEIETIQIVGAGLAGAKAAEALRKEGFEGRITLSGDEPQPPYLRPPLSKEYLRGESEPDKVLVHPEAWYVEQRIDLRTSTRVGAIEPLSRQVVFDDGRREGFDRLLIATGAQPRRLEIPGSGLPGVHYLRTRDDSDALHAAAASASRAIVIGGGWIGAEVGASLRKLGLSVTIISRDAVLFERVLGVDVGGIYQAVHAEHGVNLVMNQGAVAIHGSSSVEAVETTDGRRIEGDLVVVGIGATPRTDLASAAGLDVKNGILVDEHLESSVPGIFAAGDVAAAWSPLFEARIRSEHWDNARRQGRVAARNMLGMAEAYDRVPYVYSDQFELGMEYAGYAQRWDRVVFRGDPATREFVAFWLDRGRVVAGMNVNVWKVNPAISALVASRRQTNVAALIDPAIPLDDLEALRLAAEREHVGPPAGSWA